MLSEPGIIQSFCIRENTLDLLRMKKEGIEVFYGIRFLTICLIVLDHQIGIYNSGPISDGFTSDQVGSHCIYLPSPRFKKYIFKSHSQRTLK